MDALPITDNHCHLDPKGRRADAVRAFEREGGKRIMLVHKPYHGMMIRSAEDYRASYDVTMRLADEARKNTGVTVHVAVAPHPAELTTALKRMPLTEAQELVRTGIDIAAEYVREGRAVALGEGGRPHYPVSDEVWAASNELMRYEMECAKELDCALVLHTEKGVETFDELAAMADDVGIPRERLVRHFSPVVEHAADSRGITQSIVARNGAIKKAVEGGNHFMMETDYIDEPERPDIVMPLSTVPRITARFLENGILSDDDAWRIHSELFKKTYRI